MTRPVSRFTAAARADVERIVVESEERFGAAQALRYAQMIDRAASLAAEAPDRPSARRHAVLGDGVRSLHVGVAADRAGAAAHILFYRAERDHTVVVLRVLHERMDPMLHIAGTDEVG